MLLHFAHLCRGGSIHISLCCGTGARRCPAPARPQKAGLDRVATMRATVTQQQLQPLPFRRGAPRGSLAGCVAVRLPPARGLPAPGPAAAPAPGPSQQWHRLPSFAAPALDMGAGGAAVRTTPARARRLWKAWLNRMAKMSATPLSRRRRNCRSSDGARHTTGQAASQCNAFTCMHVEEQIRLKLSLNSSDAQFNARSRASILSGLVSAIRAWA